MSKIIKTKRGYVVFSWTEGIKRADRKPMSFLEEASQSFEAQTAVFNRLMRQKRYEDAELVLELPM